MYRAQSILIQDGPLPLSSRGATCRGRMGWNGSGWRRLVLGFAVVVGMSLLPGLAAVDLAAGADGSLTIDRVTTTRGSERVTGVVHRQPIEIHLRYSGLGSGVHDVSIRDANSGEVVVNTTVVGDTGTTDVGVAGAALSSAFTAAPASIALEARSEGTGSPSYEIAKVDGATFYLTDVPTEAGRDEAVTVSYYGWTTGAAEIGLYADHPPLADNTGEDVRIQPVTIPSPSGGLGTDEFGDTVSFTPSDFRQSGDDTVRIQLREGATPGPERYWSNAERIRITNEPPVANFTFTPGDPRVNETVTFDAGGSRDPDGRIDRYAWDFDGDGRTDATGVRVNHTFIESGQRTVALTVTDDGGASNTLRVRIPLIVSPTAAFTVTPPDPVTDRPVRFDAGGSTDPDGRIDRYAWDFDGDGRTDATGRTINFTYVSAGTYTVSLTVTDDDGATNATSRRISVDPLVAPTANLAIRPQVPTTNETTRLDAGGSADPDGRIVRYEWRFGDGVSETTATPVTEHVYATGGNYTVSVTVVDDDDARATARRSFRVNQPPRPDLAASPTAPRRNQTVTLDASSSRDLDGRIVRYAWTFGDGTETAGPQAVVTHSYGAFGNYTVTVTAVDDAGARRTAKVDLTVENRPPEAAFTFSPFRPKPDRGVQFDASQSADVDGHITGYQWDFDGDGEVEATGGPEVVYTYEERGRYEARLVVTDDAGAINATTKRITVGSTLPMLEFVILLALGIWVVVFFWLSGSLPDRITDLGFRGRAERLTDLDVDFTQDEAVQPADSQNDHGLTDDGSSSPDRSDTE